MATIAPPTLESSIAFAQQQAQLARLTKSIDLDLENFEEDLDNLNYSFRETADAVTMRDFSEKLDASLKSNASSNCRNKHNDHPAMRARDDDDSSTGSSNDSSHKSLPDKQSSKKKSTETKSNKKRMQKSSLEKTDKSAPKKEEMATSKEYIPDLEAKQENKTAKSQQKSPEDNSQEAAGDRNGDIEKKNEAETARPAAAKKSKKKGIFGFLRRGKKKSAHPSN